MQRLRAKQIVAFVFVAGWTLYLGAFAQQPAANNDLPFRRASISAAISVRFYRISALSATGRTPQTTKVNCASIRKPMRSPIWATDAEPLFAAIRSRANWCDASPPRIGRCLCLRFIPDSS